MPLSHLERLEAEAIHILREVAATFSRRPYLRGKSGEINNFTGIGSLYEPTEQSELHLSTLGTNPNDVAMRIEELLAKRKNG